MIELTRDCKAILIPSGEIITLNEGDHVSITQSLGGSHTISTPLGHYVKIMGEDADALGLEQEKDEEIDPNTPFSIELVWNKLRSIYDPEIPVNIVDLGLIYLCEATKSNDNDGYQIDINITMTAPGCGMGDVMRQEAIERINKLPEVKIVNVEIVFEPQWTKEHMSEAAKLQLGMF